MFVPGNNVFEFLARVRQVEIHFRRIQLTLCYVRLPKVGHCTEDAFNGCIGNRNWQHVL